MGAVGGKGIVDIGAGDRTHGAANDARTCGDGPAADFDRLRSRVLVARPSGDDIAEAIQRIARQRNVSQIVVGKAHSPHWWMFFHRDSLVDRLMEGAPDIDLFVVSNNEAGESPGVSGVGGGIAGTHPSVLVTVNHSVIDHNFAGGAPAANANSGDGGGIYSIGTLAVTAASTSTTVTSSANPSTLNQVVTFTASIGVVTSGAGTPRGTVQFKVNGVNFGGPVAHRPRIASVRGRAAALR